MEFQVEPRAAPPHWARATSRLPRALVTRSRARVLASLLTRVWHRARAPQEVFPTPRILQSSPHRGTCHRSWSPSASSASADPGDPNWTLKSFPGRLGQSRDKGWPGPGTVWASRDVGEGPTSRPHVPVAAVHLRGRFGVESIWRLPWRVHDGPVSDFRLSRSVPDCPVFLAKAVFVVGRVILSKLSFCGAGVSGR